MQALVSFLAFEAETATPTTSPPYRTGPPLIPFLAHPLVRRTRSAPSIPSKHPDGIPHSAATHPAVNLVRHSRAAPPAPTRELCQSVPADRRARGGHTGRTRLLRCRWDARHNHARKNRMDTESGSREFQNDRLGPYPSSHITGTVKRVSNRGPPPRPSDKKGSNCGIG
jgi:hypothetical protein